MYINVHKYSINSIISREIISMIIPKFGIIVLIRLSCLFILKGSHRLAKLQLFIVNNKSFHFRVKL